MFKVLIYVTVCVIFDSMAQTTTATTAGATTSITTAKITPPPPTTTTSSVAAAAAETTIPSTTETSTTTTKLASPSPTTQTTTTTSAAATTGYSVVVSCPEPNGRFADDEQCDAYLECKDGIAEQKFCPDGLIFLQRARRSGACYFLPFHICGKRTGLQLANPTADCPRQFGLFPSGDAKNCRFFKKCFYGNMTIAKCPEGLAFNVGTYRCVSPNLVPGCDADAAANASKV